jgi:hypothetical protein
MKGYDLFNAVRSNKCGFDPAIVGVNFARMGKDLQFIKNYFPNNYGEDFFVCLLEGYNRAYDEEFIKNMTPICTFDRDTLYIMRNLVNNVSVKDIQFHEPVIVAEISGVLVEKTLIAGDHKQYSICYEIRLYENRHYDGTNYSFWSVSISVKHNLGERDYSRQNFRITIDGLEWRENQTRVGKNISTYNYELRHGYRYNCPNSSTIAKLIKSMSDHFINKYNLKSK